MSGLADADELPRLRRRGSLPVASLLMLCGCLHRDSGTQHPTRPLATLLTDAGPHVRSVVAKAEAHRLKILISEVVEKPGRPTMLQ
ncbi:MAG: hypothetical protein ACKOKG_04605 [Verrucomicrobiota bacterium]